MTTENVRDMLTRFSLKYLGDNSHEVRYTDPEKGDYWVAKINDINFILDTLHAAWAKVYDIEFLRKRVINEGIHYSADGKVIGTHTKNGAVLSDGTIKCK